MLYNVFCFCVIQVLMVTVITALIAYPNPYTRYSFYEKFQIFNVRLKGYFRHGSTHLMNQIIIDEIGLVTELCVTVQQLYFCLAKLLQVARWQLTNCCKFDKVFSIL